MWKAIDYLNVQWGKEACERISRACHWSRCSTQQCCADQGASNEEGSGKPDIDGYVCLQQDYHGRDAERQADLFVEGDMLAQGQQNQEGRQIEKEVKVGCQGLYLVSPPGAGTTAAPMSPDSEVLSLCDEHVPR